MKEVFPLKSRKPVKKVVIRDEILGEFHVVVSKFHFEFSDILEIELLDSDSFIDFSLFFDSVFSVKGLRF
jgi:hypothetical protein